MATASKRWLAFIPPTHGPYHPIQHYPVNWLLYRSNPVIKVYRGALTHGNCGRSSKVYKGKRVDLKDVSTWEGLYLIAMLLIQSYTVKVNILYFLMDTFVNYSTFHKFIKPLIYTILELISRINIQQQQNVLFSIKCISLL